MCIAILNTKGKLKDEYIKNSWDNNNQGGGLLYAEKGKLITFKTYSYKEFLREYKKLRKNKQIEKIVLHFRIATSGHIKYINLHPFNVSPSLGFVHNGILSGLGNEEHSDTYQFNEMLQKLPANFLKNEGVRELISKYISYSKLIFLDNKNEHTIINEGLGIWDAGNWYSNDSYLLSNDFYYYGNEKINKKGYNYFEEDEFKKSYAIEAAADMAVIKEHYTNVTKENIAKFCDYLGCNVNSPQLVNEIESYSYFYNSTNLTAILDKLRQEFEPDIDNEDYRLINKY